MSVHNRPLVLVLLASFLVTGCGAVAPTATFAPATCAGRIIHPFDDQPFKVTNPFG
jgi:hypothetical protein